MGFPSKRHAWLKARGLVYLVRRGRTTNLPLQAVRATARNYHPFGQYHIVHGSSIRSIALPNREREVMSRIGDAAYGEEVDKQLDATRIWKSLYGTKGKYVLLPLCLSVK
jgi:hypothetical protein